MLVVALAQGCSELIGYCYNILTFAVEEAKARKSIYVTVTTGLRKLRRPILSDVKNDFIGMQLQIRISRLNLTSLTERKFT